MEAQQFDLQGFREWRTPVQELSMRLTQSCWILLDRHVITLHHVSSKRKKGFYFLVFHYQCYYSYNIHHTFNHPGGHTCLQQMFQLEPSILFYESEQMFPCRSMYLPLHWFFLMNLTEMPKVLKLACPQQETLVDDFFPQNSG